MMCRSDLVADSLESKYLPFETSEPGRTLFSQAASEKNNLGKLYLVLPP